MARIRTVKIGFFRNENLTVFSFPHRLLFQGLWLLADKEGRLEDRPKRIHADIFPFDPVLDIDAMLDELADGDDPFIERYEVAGRRYIQVLQFHKHQRPHHKEPESTLPGPDAADDLNPPQCLPDAPENTVPTRWIGEGNGSGKGKEGGEALARPLSPTDLRDAWNQGTTEPLPQCQELTVKRKQSAQARIREEPSLFEWQRAIAKINASSFCRGETDRGDWKASFDWLLKPDTRVKVLEGKYDNKRGRASPSVHAMDWAQECAELHGSACDSRSAHQFAKDKAAMKGQTA